MSRELRVGDFQFRDTLFELKIQRVEELPRRDKMLVAPGETRRNESDELEF